VVGAPRECSSTTGINSTPNEDAIFAGAAYVFVRSGTAWSQQAYLKASNTGADDRFGYSVAVSGDTVVVGAPRECSSTTGINSTPNEDAIFAGAAYVFVRSGTAWSQQAYLKASNTDWYDEFGGSVAVSGDTVVVGAWQEDSSTTGINSTPNDDAQVAGAAYVFVRSGTAWSQQAYLKASNTGEFDEFGRSVAVSGDTVVVGARFEDSSTTGINSTPNEDAWRAGAAYVFVRSGTAWSEQAYLKASNTGELDYFGSSVAVSGDTVVVGAPWEASSTTGINSTPNEDAPRAGAAYVFVRSGTAWSQQAYLKASNTGAGDQFGYSVAVSGDTVVVGAAYVFVRSGTAWSQQAYLNFGGSSVAVSGDTVVVGAPYEASSTTGINSTPNGGAVESGATYLFTGLGPAPTVSAPTSAAVTATTATLGGNVTADGGATITERGVVYAATATNSDPLIGGLGVVKVTTTGTTGVFTVPVSLLAAGTGYSYSYRAYAINSQGTSYSSAATFTTLSTNADLSALALSSGTLSPVFASGTTSYMANVANAVSTITVIPTRAQANATLEVRVNGGTYGSMSSGSASAALPLDVGSNTVEVKVTAQDGVTTNTYTVVVTRAPAISVQQPAGVALSSGLSLVDFGGAKALPGSSRVFTVKNTGLTSLTGLAIAISGVDAGDFSLSAAPLATLAGGKSTSFTVVFKPGSTGVKNALLRLTSSDVLIPSFEVALTGTGTAPPAFTVNPVSQLVASGSAVSFSGSASGGALSYQWLKNGANINGATSGAYSFLSVTLANAAGYSIKAVNASGSVVSSLAQLGVVDTTAKTSILGTAATASFTVTTAGNGLTYAWKKNGSDLPVDVRITGVTTKALTIKNLATSDAGVYTCVVTGPGGTLSGGANTLVVFSQKPEILTPVVMPDAIVSGSYSFPIPVNGSADLMPTSYAATGLPTGLTCNATTGVISGKPTVSKATPYAVTLKASNAKGSTTATSTLRVHALPATLTGTFNGLIDRSTELSGPSVGSALQGHGGRLSNLVITSTGNFTGTLLLEEKSYAIPGGSRLDAALGADPLGLVQIKRSGASTLHFQFIIKRTNGELVGTLSEQPLFHNPSAPTAAVRGWRQGAQIAGRTGAYTAALDIEDQVLVGDITYPQGNGYLTMSVGATGAVMWGGKLADGTAITGSSTVAAGGDIPFHQLLYSTTSAATAGSAQGWVTISDDSVDTPVNSGKALLDGAIDWLKKPQASSSTTRSYKQGFPLHNLLVGGGRYAAPAAGEVLLGVVDNGVGTTNASLGFTEGGLTGPDPIVGAAMALDLETVPVRITSRNAVVMPTGVANPATVTLAITASSGLMSGSFTLKNDPDPTDTTAPIALLTRKASYAGVLVPRLGKGIGQFQLPELPSQQGAVKITLNTSSIWSGQVFFGSP